MKSLLALLAAGVVVGAGYWKLQNPDGGVEDLQTQAAATIERLKGGVVAVRDGAPNRQNAMAEMEKKIESIEASLGAGADSARAEIVDGRLLDIERRMDSFNSQMDVVNSSTNASDTQAASTTEKIDGLSGKIDLLTRRLDEQASDQTLNGINNDMQRIEANLSELAEQGEASSANMTSRLDSLEEQSSGLLSRFNTLSVSAASNPDDGEAAANLRAQVDQRLQEVEKKFETTNTDSRRVETMVARFDQTRKQLAIMQEAQSTALSTIAELQNEVAELRTKNESLSIDGLQAEVKQQLADVRQQIDSASFVGPENVASLGDALEVTRNRIQTLEQRVQSLPAASNAASEAQQVQSGLESQIAALESKLAQVSAAADEGLVDSIAEVKEQVSALELDLRKKQSGKSIPYKIYFGRGSTGISEEAAKVLNSFIALEKNRTVGVSIYGFTDRRGAAEYNQRLALQRATNVRSYLIQKGFDYTKIDSINGLGEDAAAASLEDGTEDAQQRTVVLFAAQP